jgi:TPR repeat protein
MKKYVILFSLVVSFSLSFAQGNTFASAANTNVKTPPPTVNETMAQEIARAKQAFKSDDYHTAFSLLSKYKDRLDFDAVSQFCLGYMYNYGVGTAEDLKEAAKWYRISAENGCSCAQNNFALMYEKGAGGLPSCRVKAVEWYGKACKGGSTVARENLDRLNGMDGTKYAKLEANMCL